MILPSILSTSHLHLYEQLEELRDVASHIHVDIADGRFVPNISFGPKMIGEIYEEFGFKLDVHYMVTEPQRYIDLFKDIPQEWVSYHYETGVHPADISIPEDSRKGIAVNPDTPLIAEDILSSIDFLVIMGVYPGFGGAPFEESTFDHVRRYDALRKRTGLPFEILVDGGVGKDNIVALRDSGADHFVVGSGVFKQRPRESFIELEDLCDTHD